MEKNFIIFSLVYVLVFSVYYVAAGGFLTVLYPGNAFIAFSIFYGAYTIFSLLAPYIISIFKGKNNLILLACCICFTVYVAFIGSTIIPLLFIGSFIAGTANSFIWLIQGTFVKEKKLEFFIASLILI